jgi:hypothetical protein
VFFVLHSTQGKQLEYTNAENCSSFSGPLVNSNNRTNMESTMSRQRQADPSPEEIAERCAEIQAGWSEIERQRRLRPDWRNPAPETRTASTRDAQAIECDA